MTATSAAAKVRFPPPLVFVGAMLAGLIAHRLSPGAHLPIAAICRIPIGALMASGGAALIVWALNLFRKTQQNPTPWTPTPTLIPEGPYRWTRNPMYLGMATIQLGVGIALGNLWIIGFTPVSALIVHVIAVLPEETYLERQFGDGYITYQRAVGRYLPFLFRRSPTQ
jgi:protein-S-isoprenylcysteine O-methyltransferase Ste14